jgi:uncharacterized membrane protein
MEHEPRTATAPGPAHRPGTIDHRQLIALDVLRPAIAELIRAEHPSLADRELVPVSMVNSFRARHIESLLRDEAGSLSELDAAVARSIAAEEIIVENVEADYDARRTIGDRAADTIARFGGSWTFLILFAAILATWMLISKAQGNASFDPYPFILLNLILSTIAAVQAPIIMMSQRRQEQKDRLRARNDYQVNLKAELEIRHLHEKVEHLHERELARLAELRAYLETCLDNRNPPDR